MAAFGWSLWFDRCGSVSWLLHRPAIVGAVLIGCCRAVAMGRSLWFGRRGSRGNDCCESVAVGCGRTGGTRRSL